MRRRHPTPVVPCLLLAGIVCGAAPAAAPAGPSVVRAQRTITDHYYDVWGRTADEVFASIQRRGLGSVPGRAASGVTRANLSASMQISSSPDGPCRLEAVTLTLKIDVTLPRHGAVTTLDAATRENWETYATGVEAHEYEHVGIEERGLRDAQETLERILAGPPLPYTDPDACRLLVNAVLQDTRDRTEQRHQDFHRREAQGLRDAQNEVRRDLAALDRRIAQQAAAIGRLDATVATLTTQRATLHAELSRMIAAYGRTLPEPQFSRARELETAVAELTTEAQGVVDERNAIATEHDQLVDDRRRQADELAWIR